MCAASKSIIKLLTHFSSFTAAALHIVKASQEFFSRTVNASLQRISVNSHNRLKGGVRGRQSISRPFTEQKLHILHLILLATQVIMLS